MLMIEAVRRLRRDLALVPVVTRLGLVVMALAGAADVAIHLALGEHAGHAGVGHLAHLAGIVGMVLVLAGVVVDGARRQLDRRRRGEQWRSS
jgi:hypothetical protein